MCAINGITWQDEALVRIMNEKVAHRGPDGTAVKVFLGVTLGHNRLAILDLDSRADQPMRTLDGRYSIIFNGEIYNFKELRSDLRNRYAFNAVHMPFLVEWGRIRYHFSLITGALKQVCRL